MRRSSCQRSIRRVHRLPARGHRAVHVGPARPPRELQVGDAPRAISGRAGRVLCRTRPMTRPSNTATPSVPGGLSGKVRRQMMPGSFTATPLNWRSIASLWQTGERSRGRPLGVCILPLRAEFNRSECFSECEGGDPVGAASSPHMAFTKTPGG